MYCGLAIYATSTTIINNCTFTRINSDDGSGIIYIKGSEAYFYNSTFYNNAMDALIYVKESNRIVIDNCTFYNNTGYFFGAIYLYHTNFIVSNTEVKDSLMSAHNDTTYGIGGALYTEESEGSIINCSFKNISFDSLRAAGGAIYNLNALPISVINTTISNIYISASIGMGSAIYNQ